MRYISKRAFIADTVKKMVTSSWREDQGPAENILRLISYAPSVFGLGGMAITALDKWLSEYGYGLEDLGRYIDQTPMGSELMSITASTSISEEEFFKKTSIAKDTIVKEAFIWRALLSLIKRKGILGFIWSAITKAVKYILFAWGLTNLGELYDRFKSGDSFGMGQGLQEMMNVLPQEQPGDPSLNPENYGPQGYMGPRS